MLCSHYAPKKNINRTNFLSLLLKLSKENERDPKEKEPRKGLKSFEARQMCEM